MKNNIKIVKLSLSILLFCIIMQFLSGYLYITQVTYIIYPILIALIARNFTYFFI